VDTTGIARFPPILQLVLVGLLGGYVLLSLLGRVSPRFQWLWADPNEARGALHWMEYTVIPALLLVGAVWAVVARWNPDAPLTGGWTVRELTVGPGLALAGVVLVAAAAVAQRARESAVNPAPAWIPAVMMLLGLGALVVGVLTLGGTVKKHKARARAGTPRARLVSPSRAGSTPA
jgi:hypothetical protein